MNVNISFDPKVVQAEGMKQRPEGYLYREDVAPGAAWWTSYLGDPKNQISHLKFACPCGCGDILGIPICGEGAWKWNGNKELPTLTPSIQKLYGCRWHGHLTNGIFDSV